MTPTIATYLTDLRARRYPANTLRSYRTTLDAYAAREPALGTANTKGAIRSWLATMTGDAASTVNKRLWHLRAFFAWARDEGLVATSEAHKVEPLKVPGVRPRHLSEAAMTATLEVPGSRPRDVRDRALLEMLYGCGLRAAELVALDLGDVADGAVRVRHGKGDKPRQVPCAGAALVALEAWLRVRPALAIDSEGALFVGARGRRLEYRAVLQTVKRWAPPGTTPHAFRHSMATHLLKRGCNLLAVSELLGHASVKTTQIYTHLDAAFIRDAYEAAHPRAKGTP